VHTAKGTIGLAVASGNSNPLMAQWEDRKSSCILVEGLIFPEAANYSGS